MNNINIISANQWQYEDYGFRGMTSITKRQNYPKLHLMNKKIDSEHQQHADA